jgi:4-hydroxybenzoate polyprenyltransferase
MTAAQLPTRAVPTAILPARAPAGAAISLPAPGSPRAATATKAAPRAIAAAGTTMASDPTPSRAAPAPNPGTTTALTPSQRTAPRRAEPQATAAPAPIPSFARKPAPAPRDTASARPADTSTRSVKVIGWLLGYLPMKHRARIREYLVLMRMDRPVGALLLLWPTWWALWFAANDFPPIGSLLVFTLGVFVMRSAGCVVNDYADHGWLDANVKRTRGRPMVAGRVSKKEALALFGGLLALAFVLVLFTNALTIKLSFIGAALAAIYPFSKRVTHLAQVVLGAAFGWSIPMAFAAVTNSLPPLCWLLFLANVLFSTIYDTEYAMVDRDDDIRVGAKSTAILFGDADRAAIGVLMATFLLAMLLAGTRATLHWPYFVGLATASGLLAYQEWLIRDRSRAHCFAAFHNNNWVGFALWIGLVLALAIR